MEPFHLQYYPGVYICLQVDSLTVSEQRVLYRLAYWQKPLHLQVVLEVFLRQANYERPKSSQNSIY